MLKIKIKKIRKIHLYQNSASCACLIMRELINKQCPVHAAAIKMNALIMTKNTFNNLANKIHNSIIHLNKNSNILKIQQIKCANLKKLICYVTINPQTYKINNFILKLKATLKDSGKMTYQFYQISSNLNKLKFQNAIFHFYHILLLIIIIIITQLKTQNQQLLEIQKLKIIVKFSKMKIKIIFIYR